MQDLIKRLHEALSEERMVYTGPMDRLAEINNLIAETETWLEVHKDDVNAVVTRKSHTISSMHFPDRHMDIMYVELDENHNWDDATPDYVELKYKDGVGVRYE